MGILGLSLCANKLAAAIVVILCLTLISALTPAMATMRIAEDRGGQIGHYIQNFESLRSSGERVVIDGNCLSACTLVLGLIPHDHICATARARFGFHAAWMPDEEGRPVTSRLGTQALWNIYPKPVRRWINRHGGLSRKMIYMQGRDLRGIVGYCAPKTPRGPEQNEASNLASERPKKQAHRSRAHHRLSSERRLAGRPLRYSTASAANDRR